MEQPSIKQLFQGLIPDQGGVIRARVISLDPLRIQAINDDKLLIGANSVIIPHHLTDYQTSVDIPDAGLENVVMTIRNSLNTGDTVHLLSFNQGKKYFILDRA